ncbi:MAG: endonuclease III [Candidatus Harrisonbacteria bacterium CG10_big_fil_rev_8_21_14_0_10_42_17]|uniref:Adenine DNA glycosylase n=1 Tax=Candidatus Harrisonbacteria bacterium CG10_big_fil_rev_8_21_14_0_10_42_17 TaxID=1974584 RepID=A0A2M6WJ21_9BACT|nr:MAG: endonuclease III [Candidatus Harrisonbacteria bacterium CG10_big_fil_rev_8_21_14_0_10_42_17]
MTYSKDLKMFRKTIWDFYRDHRRDLPWRPPLLRLRKDGTVFDPYRVYVSEIMLQQTQVSRVLQKYPKFIEAFPNFNVLARAPLREILRVWQGMGYNRRALAMKKAAELVVRNHEGVLPRQPELLMALPGIGPATAGSIATFAFNHPSVFIETNIRRVFLHHFFPTTSSVSDEELVKLVAAALPRSRAREWYSALMDYGTVLSKRVPNPNQRSKHYAKQSPFVGSNRQIRGSLLRILSKKPHTLQSLQRHFSSDVRLRENIGTLRKEGFIKQHKSLYYL